jgi:hypothetical protein
MATRVSIERAVVTVVLLLGVAAAIGWWQRGWLQGLPARVGWVLPGPEAQGQAAVPSTHPRSAAAAGGARRCRTSAGIVYTNGACPPGSREEAIARGSVTVLPAPPVTARPAAAPASGSGSLLRELAGSDEEMRRMREQMIDRATR